MNKAKLKATVLSMHAIRAVNPIAKLVQTDDLSKTYSTPEMAWLANFFNERRWLAWDILCGKVDPQHKLWTYMLESGATREELMEAIWVAAEMRAGGAYAHSTLALDAAEHANGPQAT